MCPLYQEVMHTLCEIELVTALKSVPSVFS